MNACYAVKRIIISAFGAAAAATVLVLNPAVRSGVKEGLLLCAESIIPSLFLFTAVAMFISSSGAAYYAGKLFEPVSKVLFKMDGEQFSVFLLSLLSGYPVGARLISGLYERKVISKNKAEEMLSFCVNPGPAFVLNAVGIAVLGSVSDGRRLLAAYILSSVLMAAVIGNVSALFNKDGNGSLTSENCIISRKPFPAVSDAFVTSVTGASTTMISVCSFVILFSGIGALIGSLSDGLIAKFAGDILEVTVGVQGSARSELEKVAFLLGFGGISVICQVMSAAGQIRPRFFRLLLYRLIHGMFCAAAVYIMELVSPRVIETSSFAQNKIALHTSVPASIALVAVSFVLIFYINGYKAVEIGK